MHRKLVDMLDGEVGMFKIGLQLFCSEGWFVRELVERGTDFLDLNCMTSKTLCLRAVEHCPE